MKKLLCIDYGTKSMGLAIADPDLEMALPRPALLVKSLQTACEEICETCKDEWIETLLIGLPVGQDGAMTDRAEEVLYFIELLQSEAQKQDINTTVHTVNEFLTTQVAGSYLGGKYAENMRGFDTQKQKENNKKAGDSAAAALLYERWGG